MERKVKTAIKEAERKLRRGGRKERGWWDRACKEEKKAKKEIKGVEKRRRGTGV